METNSKVKKWRDLFLILEIELINLKPNAFVAKNDSILLISIILMSLNRRVELTKNIMKIFIKVICLKFEETYW